MKNFKFWAVAALLAVSASASAQFTNTKSTGGGVSTDISNGWSTFNVQYNASSFIYDVSGADNESFSAFTLEYTNAIGVSKSLPLFVEWGVGLQYGFKSDSDSKEDSGYKIDIEKNFSMLSVPIPVSLVYDYQIPNSSISIDPYLGLKLRANILAQEKVERTMEYRGEKESEDDTRNLFDKDDMGGSDNTWNRFQVGWQIGANARFNNKFMVGISYGSDFSELAEKTKIGQFTAKIGLVF